MFMSVPYSVSFNGDDAISFETENVLEMCIRDSNKIVPKKWHFC